MHAVIQANRTVYATNVVDKMQEKGIVQAAEHWRQENALPLPAQFLMETGRLVAEQGSGIKDRLASLWPIYVWNNPQSDFERKGLEAVVKNPDRPFTGFVRTGREKYFQAIYADLAVAHACAECHNKHPNSPRRDYTLNDVMGASSSRSRSINRVLRSPGIASHAASPAPPGAGAGEGECGRWCPLPPRSRR